MRLFSIFLGIALGSGFALSAPLTDADREALLERLDGLKSQAVERTDARFRAAMSAYTAAMGSDEMAMDLYLKCVEKVDFGDQNKKAGDFREWKRREEEKLSKPGLKTALRHQLRWLVLTLQAASENSDRAKLEPQAQQAVDAVFANMEAMKDQQTLLRQAVTSSVFARAYEISSIKVDDWAMSPVDIPMIYEKMIFPRYRNLDSLPQLRESWNRRIQQEGAIQEFWAGAADPNARAAAAVGGRSPELDKFMSTTLPALQWQMEMDLFKAGDQKAAALRMVAHIEKNVAHPSAKGWSDEFKQLLAPGTAVEPTETKKAAPDAEPDGTGM